MAAELVLGAVQLGLPYGAANRTGQPSRAAALRLVSRAVDHGISTFDTARAYGESEERLGEALSTRRVRMVTKLSPLADLPDDAPRELVRNAVDASLEQSFCALRKEQLDCLMLHRAAHRTSHRGAIWERLIERLEDGSILALGVSVQTPEEALEALACPDVQHLQMPFNLLDWRWRAHGVIKAIRARPHVTIHVRSVFLQGVLAARDPSVWPSLSGVSASALIAHIDRLVAEFGRHSPADLCLAYVRGQDWVDGVVVGMETEDQLESNVSLFVRPPLSVQDCARIEDCSPQVPETLLNPAMWPARA
ncbi:MAG: aldo/keto reductase [Alphaproteobacteria bacterium]|nr:aldo/keto reductase [Alphaproteobacteria bacterium]